MTVFKQNLIIFTGKPFIFFTIYNRLHFVQRIF